MPSKKVLVSTRQNVTEEQLDKLLEDMEKYLTACMFTGIPVTDPLVSMIALSYIVINSLREQIEELKKKSVDVNSEE